jgi:hypothetical protein
MRTGADLKTWRQIKSWSQEATALAIGISRRSVQTYEDSDKPLPLVVIQSMRWVDYQSREKTAHKARKPKDGGN